MMMVKMKVKKIEGKRILKKKRKNKKKNLVYFLQPHFIYQNQNEEKEKKAAINPSWLA